MISFLPSIGYPELLLLLVVGLLLYGRNLPQAGRTLGRFVAQMKRGFQDFKDQMDRDESLREVKQTLDQTRRELQNVTALPRAMRNPAGALRELAQEAVTSPAGRDEVPDEPPPPPDAAPPAQPGHPKTDAPEADRP